MLKLWQRVHNRDLLVGAVGALIGIAATVVFDLRIHVGFETVTGSASYVLSAVGGTVTAYALDHGLRQVWPI